MPYFIFSLSARAGSCMGKEPGVRRTKVTNGSQSVFEKQYRGRHFAILDDSLAIALAAS